MPIGSVPSQTPLESRTWDRGRVTPIGACLNFRHMGGYATGDGRTTRGDLLFRSGWLELNNQGEVEQFSAKRIRHICDFRSEAEIARQPFRLPEPHAATLRALPINHGSMAGYLQGLSTGSSSAADTRLAMSTMYREMIHEGAPQFAAMLDVAAQSDGPLLVACTLGKDRTGVAAAILLAALGVHIDDIFSDYLASADIYTEHAEELYQTMKFSSFGASFDVARDILIVHEEYLAAAWNEIKDNFGGMDQFATAELGLSEQRRQELIDKYTV
jgi:protein-tyrosine phosphatase